MRYFTIVLLCLFFALVKSQSGNQTDGCMPSNCQATCTPACSTGKTCVLGTMKLCGQCPISTCVDNSILGPSNPNESPNPNNSNNNDNDNGPDGGMIGGLVGGLVGGGLLIGTVVYCFLRRQNKKKQGLPFAAPRLGTPSPFHSPNNALSQRSVTPMNGNHPMSSMISHHSQLPPPPSPLQNVQFIQEKEPIASSSLQQQYQPQLQQNEKDISLSQLQVPPSDLSELNDIHRSSTISSQLRPTSSSSFLSEDDDDSSLGSVSQRGSVAVATTITPGYRMSHQATKSATAFQVTRIKPQIMRVNTVRVLDSPTPGSSSSNNNLSRSGSVRTILTRDNSVASNLSRSNTAPTRPRNKKNNSNDNDQDKKSYDNIISPQSTTSPRRISAPLLSPSQINPFHDRHSVIEEGDDKNDGLSNDQPSELNSVNPTPSPKDI